MSEQELPLPDVAAACTEQCVYGVCRKTMADPYGCGGCCNCLSSCQVEYEQRIDDEAS